MSAIRLLGALAGALVLAGCVAESTTLPLSAGIGPDPTLPPPVKTIIPTVHIARAKGWPASAKPIAAPALSVATFATGLQHPRWIYVLPNGDVLVAETNAPPRPEEGKGIRSMVMHTVMKEAGAAVPSANRITLFRDANGDGIADTRSVFLENLNSPFGMALVGGDLYVANSNAVVKFPYTEGATRIDSAASIVTDLPAGSRNHHWTKNIIASRDGTKLYATVGSNSNVAEHGMQEEEGRAAIWEIDLKSGAKRLLATGLRNPNGLGWEPKSGVLWTVVNERDELGSDLVPDYLTSVREGAFYGWPYSYYGAHVDERVQPPRPDLVAKALKPDYALGSHVAPLGLAFADGSRLPAPFSEGAFVGQHGSWNRHPRSGYNVVFVPFRNGKPSGQPIDVLTGFLSPQGEAYGRPVGVAIDKRGALLVVDDVGNTIWRVTSSGSH
ncbi:MAG TPA: sorbosone dehydrogenase family protein [Usitatibacter sp.]|nr:sorbosone dehydrogenase family protein [Usitatibacter sp.]